MWDLTTKGVRLFRFLDSRAVTIYNLEQTIDLFCMECPDHVEKNRQFMHDYAGKDYPARNSTPLYLNGSDLNFGDFLGQFSFGGFETMEAWGMGSVTSHTAIVVQNPDTKEWLICESTDPYIICTPFQQWIDDIGGLLTIAPLSPSVAANFNQTAAWEYIQTVLGYSYGYMNFLWGWIDTPDSNFPCLPPFPDTDICLMWEQVEILTGVLESYAPPLAEIFYRQAFRLRLNNTQTLPDVASIYRYAASLGIDTPTLFSMVESDSFKYNTSFYGKNATGPAMVCDVFVCNVWKAAGVFDSIDSNFNCAEFTNWDAYCLDIFDPNYQQTRPLQCQQQDPNIPECQIIGDYQLAFNDYMTRTPYAHMADHCPGQPPNYTKTPGC